MLEWLGQLLCHLDGDVALLMPESQRVIPGVLMNSLLEHYGSPGLAEYKCQFIFDICGRVGDVGSEGILGY